MEGRHCKELEGAVILCYLVLEDRVSPPPLYNLPVHLCLLFLGQLCLPPLRLLHFESPLAGGTVMGTDNIALRSLGHLEHSKLWELR